MLRNNVVTVDLGKIRQNYLLQKSLLPRKTEIMPVVKADAYGHGMVPVATALHSMGAKHFAVALAEEGVELREGGISGEILVLGPAMEEAAEECVRHDLTQTVFTPEMVEILEKEVGIVFTNVLEDAGVYKCTEEGRIAFKRFIETL